MSNEPSGVGKPAGKGLRPPDGAIVATPLIFWKSRASQCARLRTHDSET
jgi:hypothetical protein